MYFLEGCGRGGAWREVRSNSIKLTETLWIFSLHFNQNLRQLNAIASTCSAETRLWPPYSPDSAFCKGVCVGLSQAFLLRLFCLVLIVTEPQKDWRGFLHILVVNQAEQGHASGSLTCHINFSHKRITGYLGFLSFYFFEQNLHLLLILPYFTPKFVFDWLALSDNSKNLEKIIVHQPLKKTKKQQCRASPPRDSKICAFQMLIPQ